ncbi:hypothetical protein IHE56_04380 [Streptomyces sp. ID01-12c]|uniref:hypothetical protein n=1 Tax=Streptomyces caniscabiei TaxID=2746961 RepID=UPI001784797B|nr:hypothetical protein [Streptomyces caniscabiei]MBD9701340.1 hypothetical protein [Streptomyces caniscabiei]MDX3726480.1 hypothetical protein [Streptomyces caniscabiei]
MRNSLNRGVMWGAGAMAILVLALTAYAFLDGDDGSGDGKSEASPSATASGKPAPTYTTPEDWTEPERWVALPSGERTDDSGNETGFPRTTEGAVAMLKATSTVEVSRERSAVEEQLGLYNSYMVRADRSAANAEKVERDAADLDKSLHRQMGVDAADPMPSGAYMRTYVVGYQVIEESDGEVSAWLLCRTTLKTGETKKETASYSRNLLAAVWEGGDWKLSSAATVRASEQTAGKTRPEMVAPGDAEFNSAGWTAIREAS